MKIFCLSTFFCGFNIFLIHQELTGGDYQMDIS
jgi:hypothetical protein